MKKKIKDQAPPTPKKPDRLTPEQCAVAGDFYEHAALKVQELYTMGATVSEAVKHCLTQANLIRAGKSDLVSRS